jgi:hypothetical protein
MSHQVPPTVPQDYLAEVDLENARWSEITALIHVLTPDERLAPGYFREPDWSVKDPPAQRRVGFVGSRTTRYRR